MRRPLFVSHWNGIQLVFQNSKIAGFFLNDFFSRYFTLKLAQNNHKNSTTHTVVAFVKCHVINTVCSSHKLNEASLHKSSMCYLVLESNEFRCVTKMCLSFWRQFRDNMKTREIQSEFEEAKV